MPLILCLLATRAMDYFIRNSKDIDCSDQAITNEIVSEAGKTMEDIYNTNVRILIFDLLNLLMIFLPIIYRGCCGGGPIQYNPAPAQDPNKHIYDPKREPASTGASAAYGVEMSLQGGPAQHVPAYGNPGDMNNDGIPDTFQQNLPPGFECKMADGKPYWVNHNDKTSSWVDPRTLPQYQQYNPQAPSYAPSNPFSADANGNGIPDIYETNLPPNWQAFMTPEGRVYWVNHATQQSSWQDPRSNNGISYT